MRRLTRQLICVLGTVLVVALAAGGAEAAVGRVTGTFVMTGRVTVAVRVYGERRGQRVRRHWTFTGIGCGRRSCRRLRLRRERSAGLFSTLTLRRTRTGSYTGSGRFFAALTCKGAFYPRGEVVPYTVTLRIRRAVTVQGIHFARQLRATYDNPYRIDRTICPLGPSRDAGRYTGSIPAPTPPHAAFTATVDGATEATAFSDTSTPGTGGARVVFRAWQFGDTASGSADTATGAAPSHRFTAPGVYQVTLTVTDANGLRSATTQTVVAPGPPTAGFTASPAAVPLTDTFADQSQPGLGGAPVQAWSWNFGDPASGAANTAATADTQHTFSAPATYTVTLTVTDANGRSATIAQPVTVPAAP